MQLRIILICIRSPVFQYKEENLAIADLNAQGKTTMNRAKAASISYPNFVNTLIQREIE